MALVLDGTTGVSGVDGSASTPALQGTDTNTGVTFPAADTVGISTGGSERMRVDSSGNVGVGTSSPDALLTVNTVASFGDGSASAPSIAHKGDLNTGIYFSAADTVDIATGGVVAITVDSGQRTKFPTTIGVGGATPSTSGSGVSFPASQSASTDVNTLDDYEEGTFTPTMSGTTTAGTGTYSIQVGRYTKIGNRVFYVICLTWTAHTGAAGSMQLSGLPFTSNSTANNIQMGSILLQNVSLTAAYYPLTYVGNNTTNVTLRQVPTGGGADAAISLDSSGSATVAGHYEV